MENYPSNTQKSKEAIENVDSIEAKVIKKIVSGGVSRQKKPLSKRFLDTFIGGDATSVWEYIVKEVLVPSAKDVLSDVITQGIEKILYGESRPGGRRPGTRNSTSGYTSYNRYSSPNSNTNWGRGREEPRRDLSRHARGTHNFDDIILQTRAEADEVLDRLFDIILQHEVATVHDLYELVGIQGDYTDQKYGWKELPGAEVKYIRGNYLLKLPRPEHID